MKSLQLSSVLQKLSDLLPIALVSRTEVTRMRDLHQSQPWVPPGHFYSPIHAPSEVAKYQEAIEHNEASLALQGILLHPQKQQALFEKLLKSLKKIPYAAKKKKGYRYFFENGNFEYFDGSVLFAMLLHVKPKRVIEIGSGYSTCVMLDVKEQFAVKKYELTCIEPYPALLYSLTQKKDQQLYTCLDQPLQSIDLSLFETLQANDILFIDSTHVSKFNSDVNRELFDILPRLNSGVYIHFHDIFYPFEYPQAWLEMGIAWNEIYLLRALLAHSDAFEIVFMNSYFGEKFNAQLSKKYPLGAQNIGGSLWLRKK